MDLHTEPVIAHKPQEEYEPKPQLKYLVRPDICDFCDSIVLESCVVLPPQSDECGQVICRDCLTEMLTCLPL